jgi:hypothetical protein
MAMRSPWVGMSIAPFFSDAEDMASALAYHDVRELLSQTPQGGAENETMAYSILSNDTKRSIR